jgi:hypothetical protein
VGGWLHSWRRFPPSQLHFLSDVVASGSSCYRKNPQHRLEESHPGDQEEVEEDSAAAKEKERSGAEAAIQIRKAEEARAKIQAKAEVLAEQAAALAAAEDDARAASAVASPVKRRGPADDAASSPVSPTANRKMSVKDRRRLQQQQKETEQPAAASASASAASIAAPLSLPTIPAAVVRATSLISDLERSPLLASLHALYKCPSIPEFTEIREDGTGDGGMTSSSGRFFIGRSSSGAAADGSAVEKVGLVLQSDSPRLAKMISRVHASIEWQRSVVEESDLSATTVKGRSGKRASSVHPPSYSYRWFLSDECSVNGVFVNHVKIPSGSAGCRGQSVELHPGDTITFGGGLGRKAGEHFKQKLEEAQFVFTFQCVQKAPELDAVQEGEEEQQETKQAPANTRSSGTSVRKRPNASAASPSKPSPALKRQKSEDGRLADSMDESVAVSAPIVSDATQHFGDACDFPLSEGPATQEYVDHERDSARARAQEGATQDFSSASQLQSQDAADATQDAGAFPQ